MYTSEQQARRDASPLTRAMMAASMAQLIVIIASYCFVFISCLPAKAMQGR